MPLMMMTMSRSTCTNNNSYDDIIDNDVNSDSRAVTNGDHCDHVTNNDIFHDGNDGSNDDILVDYVVIGKMVVVMMKER